LELFFDLVFVAVVAQLSHRLAEDPSPGMAFRFGLAFLPVWWAWIGSTIYLDRFETDDASQRLAIFLLMISIAGMAVFANEGLQEEGSGFAIAYVLTRGWTGVLWLRAGHHNPPARPVTHRYALGIALAALPWVWSIWVSGPLKLVLWGVGLAVDLAVPLTALPHERRLPRLSPTHLPERFGLFTIIVLGESVIAVITATAGRDELELPVMAAAVAGLGLAFGLWWIYFDELYRRDLVGSAATALRWTYGHLPLVVGVTAMSAGVLHAVQASEFEVASQVRWLIAGGLALALVSIAHLETTVEALPRMGSPLWLRLVAAGAALVAAAAGGELTGLGFLAVQMLLLAAQIVCGAWGRAAPALEEAEVEISAGA
jgi:low temperature requirement protein LtrA